MAKSTPIIEKIALLLAKAESTNSEHEAEALFEAAQKLMVRHAIDESMLPKGDARREQIVTRKVALRARDELWKQKAVLLNELCNANRCRMIAAKKQDVLLVIGHESDALFVEMLYASVLIQLAGARTRGWKDYQATVPAAARQSRFLWVNSFAAGYAHRVGERLRQQAADEVSSTGQELVLRDRAKDVDDWMDGNVKSKMVTVRSRGGDGTAAGRDAAGRADLTGGRNNLAGRGAAQIGR